ncbi:MAG: outer membrane protein assembly factor BamC, partial [Methylomonas sp.]
TENSAGLPETVGKSTEKSKMPIDGSSEEKPKEEKEKPKEEKPAYAELSKLILLVGDPKKPTLQLKTRFDRAWILVADGLSAAGIQVVDTKQDAGVFRVSYVDNDKGKGRGLINSLTSFFSDELEDTEYTLTVDRDKKITDVHVDKVLKADSGKEASNNDDSAALMQLLHKSIIDNLSK